MANNKSQTVPQVSDQRSRTSTGLDNEAASARTLEISKHRASTVNSDNDWVVVDTGSITTPEGRDSLTIEGYVDIMTNTQTQSNNIVEEAPIDQPQVVFNEGSDEEIRLEGIQEQHRLVVPANNDELGKEQAFNSDINAMGPLDDEKIFPSADSKTLDLVGVGTQFGD